MGKVIRVTPERLKSAAEKIGQLSNEYQTIYNQLIQQARTMGSSWDSADNKAFVSQIEGFCDDLKQMKNKLDYGQKMICQQSLNYVQIQNHNLAQIKKLAN